MHRIVFLHIPKTAGTTFRQVIRRNYTPTERFGLDNEQKIQTDIKLNNLTAEKRKNIKFLGGHINFGIHQSFNSEEEFKYITFLRDPVQREISYYYHVLRMNQHPYHQEVVTKRMSLEDYLTSHMHKMLINAQTKQIAGIQGGLQSKALPFDKTDSLLEVAKNNLEKYFIFSGITEHFDEGLILLHKILHWKFPLYYKPLNTAPDNLRYKDIPQKAEQIIADQSKLDMLLYSYVKGRFLEQIRENKGYINRHMHMLKICNTLYNSYTQLRSR